MNALKLLPTLPLLCIGLVHSEELLEQVIVTATQHENSRFEIPMSTAILLRRDLETVLPVHINEVFQRSSGTWISRGNGQESLTALRSPVLTGAGSCGAFFMAADGISLRAPGFCNVNQMFDANTEQADKIEVLKGPGTALYGSGAMHGLINVITPRPTPENLHIFGIEAGPHDYRRGRYRYSGTRGRHGLLMAVNAAEDRGYKDESGFDQHKGSFRHTYADKRFEVDSILAFTDLDQETAGFIQGHRAYENSALKKHNPNPEAYRKAESRRFQSSLSVPMDESREWVVTPYWRDNSMEFLQHFLPWQPVEKNGAESFGLNTKYYLSNGRMNAVVGVDVDYTDGWLEEVQAQAFSANQPAGVHYDYRVEAVTAGAWFELGWELSQRWNLSHGARHEYNEYDYRNRAGDGPACEPTAPACRFYRPLSREDSFSNWSFHLGLLFDFHPRHGAFARASRGFRAPQASELYRLQSGQERADLDSEQLDSFELGLRGGTKRWQYELAAYYSHKSEVIFQDADRRNVSGADTLHYGLDFSLRWQFAENFDLAVDATLQRHEYDDDINLFGSNRDIGGHRIDTAPDSFGSLRLGWDFGPGQRAELEWVNMDSYYLEPDNQHQYDGHELLNLRLFGAVSDHFSIGFRIVNITDEDYAERADYGFGEYRYFVGEERSVFGHIEYRIGQ